MGSPLSLPFSYPLFLPLFLSRVFCLPSLSSCFFTELYPSLLYSFPLYLSLLCFSLFFEFFTSLSPVLLPHFFLSPFHILSPHSFLISSSLLFLVFLFLTASYLLLPLRFKVCTMYIPFVFCTYEKFVFSL